MAQFDREKQALVGAGGLLSVRADDEITRKLSMLIEGECEGFPDRLAAEHVDPHIPWLYGYKLDFSFR